MKLEEQVLTIEQAKHLQKLGLDMSDAALCWSCSILTHLWEVIPITEGTRDVLQGRDPYVITPVTPTYTLQELLKKFPAKYHDRVIARLTNGVTVTYGQILEISRCTGAGNEIFYGFHYGSNLFNGVTDPNPLQAAYKMFCWLFEEGNVKEEKE